MSEPKQMEIATVEPLPIEKADVLPAAPAVSAQQSRNDAVALLTTKAYERASTLELTKEEIAGLQAEFPDSAFQKGASGKENLIYIEHAALRERLNAVIGIGQWAIIPRSRWTENFRTATGKDAVRVYVEAMLLVRGAFVAEAVGDMTYYTNNDAQNFGDAVEGAKTAALRRCAKELGIGLQAWSKAWCEGWWQRQRQSASRPIAHPAPSKPVTVKPAQPERTATEIIVESSSTPTTCPKCGSSDSMKVTRDGITYFACNNCNEEWQDKPAPKATAPLAKETQAVLDNLQKGASEFGAEWKSLIVPFGKDKDATFGSLEKGTLWWWIMCWANKPLEPREFKGKMYDPKPHEVRIWTVLNENRSAIAAHYKFSEPKD